MDDSFPSDALYLKNFGGILIEAASELPAYWLVGHTTDDEKITVAGESVTLDELTAAFEGKLESVFPTKAAASDEHLTKVSFTEHNAAVPAVKSAKPLAVIPVFPGTNCEYDTARAVENAGGAAEIVVVLIMKSMETKSHFPFWDCLAKSSVRNIRQKISVSGCFPWKTRRQSLMMCSRNSMIVSAFIRSQPVPTIWTQS